MNIKSYTNISQSRKLAEILPLESADMHYINDKHAGCVPYLEMKKDSNPWLKGVCVSPCWSLVALLGVLPRPSLHQTKDKRWYCNAEPNGLYFSKHYNNPVDACVAMIERLHELKML